MAAGIRKRRGRFQVRGHKKIGIHFYVDSHHQLLSGMLYKTCAFIFFIALVTQAAIAQKKVFKISDYGAVANSQAPNTAAIQKTIDACSAAGGGMVLVPGNPHAATAYLTGTIILKNNVELHIDSGAVLLGSTDYKDYEAIEPFVDG